MFGSTFSKVEKKIEKKERIRIKGTTSEYKYF